MKIKRNIFYHAIAILDKPNCFSVSKLKNDWISSEGYKSFNESVNACFKSFISKIYNSFSICTGQE